MKYEKNIGKFRFSNQDNSDRFTVSPADVVSNVNESWEIKDFDTEEEAKQYGITTETVGCVTTSGIGSGNVTKTLHIGSRNETLLFTNGDIAEIIICESLSSAKLLEMYDYAKNKYPSIP